MSTKGTRIPDRLKYRSPALRPHHRRKRVRTCFPPATGARSGRCTATSLPPCNNACGTNEKIQGYLDLVKRGKYLDAYALIKEDMPFPSVTGRVCYHPCEQACNRGQVRRGHLDSRGRALPRRSRTGTDARRGEGRAAERQESRRRRFGPCRAQRGVPTGAARLQGDDPGEVAEGRRTESRRHSGLGASAGHSRSRDRAPGQTRHHDQDATSKSAKTSAGTI